VIADSNPAAAGASPSASSTQAGLELDSTSPESLLSARELYQLTLYKWRYSLEAFGFDAREVRDLMFLKWLYASRRVTS
jgi:hypothetical protein